MQKKDNNIKQVLTQFAKDYLPAISLFFIILIVWEMAVKLLGIPRYVLPKPSVIIQRLIKEKSNLIYHLGITMIAAISGLLLGSVIAFVTSVSFLFSKLLEKAIYPWAILVRSIPVVAIAPLLTIWLGYGIAPKIAIAAIICFFPILVNTTKGLKATDKQAIELMELLGAGKLEILYKLRIPNALPYVFAAFKISGTVAVIGAIVAEFTGSDAGIGSVIIAAGYRMDSALLFAAIIVSAVASISMFYIIVILEKLAIFWPEEQGGE